MKKIISGSLVVALVALCSCTNITEHNSMDQEYIDLIKNWKNPKELAEMPSMNWESKCNYKIVYASEKLVSYKIFSWSYSGGAHGMPYTQVGTVRNGKILKLADLPENIETLWKQALKSHPEFKTIKEYSDFLGELPKITENFYLDDKGVHFIYQPYEIAPFATGTIDIFVPGKFE